ncbi:winged helix-turn-helix DNA-binding domain, heat shock transcription factor family protein [Tanacetum coccineum]
MVSDKDTNSIISWGSSSTSFIIFDEQRFTSEILPSYFKTSRLDSFTSQLYNYGFSKTGCRHLEFEHEHFQEGKQHLLKTIMRRSQQSKVINSTPSLCVATNEFIATFGKVCHGQKQIFNRIQRFKLDIEKTLSEVQNITESLSHNNTISTFSKDIGGKRKFVDSDSSIVFADIEKDLATFYNQFKVPESGIDDFKTLSDLTQKVATGRGVRGGGRRVPDFLHKLYDMLEKQELDDIISWKLPKCDSFIIWDINKFATHVLPMYFNHSNFSSFNSQLNIYEFKKVNWELHEYANEWFRGGRKDLLQNITRRPKKQQRMDHITTRTAAEMEMFTHRLKTIQQEQKRKITWISYYEEQMRSSVDGLKEMAVNMANIANKLTLKSIKNLEHVKKAKLVIEDNGNTEGQPLEVNELGEDQSTLEENNNDVADSFFQELEIDFEAVDNLEAIDNLEAVDKYFQMDETWIVEREIKHYLSV